ncbi:GyrI-like domain-containing protein [Rhodoferax ferrireducens]|uniref:GyrI-like domain-containing protein n=1 Tax=Rhodoferax ferrireducens TaxID=192843 RepID=UPI000E0D09E4|nr:effector binding domain-containing protein [Rhodoferax ferrireducens]
MSTPQFPHHFEALAQAITVVGIELRTSNAEAMQTIPPHWQRFGQEGVLANIGFRRSDDVFAVYTHFENAGSNNTGLYSLVIGAAVPADAPVPAGMVRVVVPASPRVVFGVEKGRFDLVGAAWQAIWARTELAKTFVAEYEQYRASGDITISIGLSPSAPQP